MPGSSGYLPGTLTRPATLTSRVGSSMRDCMRSSRISGSMMRSRPDSRSNTKIRSRGASSKFAAEPGSVERALEVGREHANAAVGRQLAADQHVALIGVRLQLVEARQHVGEAHARLELILAGPVHVAAHGHRVLEHRTDRRDAQRVATAQQLRSAGRARQVDVDRHARAPLVDALERRDLRIRFGRQPAAELQQLAQRSFRS